MCPRDVFGQTPFLVDDDNTQGEAHAQDTSHEEQCPIDALVMANLGALRNIYIGLERDIRKMETLYKLYRWAKQGMATNDDEVVQQELRLARNLRIKEKVRNDILTLERAQLDYWGGFLRPDAYIMALRASTPW
jgi:uracil DNA glycosylase